MMRAASALFALFWSIGAAAAGQEPASEPAPSQGMAIYWVPVPSNYPGAMPWPMPFFWMNPAWLPARPANPWLLPPSPETVSPPVGTAPAPSVADPVPAAETAPPTPEVVAPPASVQEAPAPTPVPSAAVEAAPPESPMDAVSSMPEAEMVVQPLPPVSASAPVVSPAKPAAKGAKPRLRKPRPPSADAKPKRRMCWKDNTLSPCP